jgi:hypothetical protein
MTKRPDTPTEDELQVYSADVVRAFCVPGVVAWHTPNQNMAKVQYRVKLKAFGALPGVSDWTFIRRGLLAAFVEIKTLTGRQSDDQKKFQAAVEACGCTYAIARTPEEIDRVFSALGVINKSVSPRGSLAMGRAGRDATHAPSGSKFKVAA